MFYIIFIPLCRVSAMNFLLFVFQLKRASRAAGVICLFVQYFCGFKRNSSNLDRAAKMRDSFLLNSWDSFLVTLLSISSETGAVYSSLVLGTDVFLDWPFLEISSCVSVVTFANFRLFLNVAIFFK